MALPCSHPPTCLWGSSRIRGWSGTSSPSTTYSCCPSQGRQSRARKMAMDLSALRPSLSSRTWFLWCGSSSSRRSYTMDASYGWISSSIWSRCNFDSPGAFRRLARCWRRTTRRTSLAIAWGTWRYSPESGSQWGRSTFPAHHACRKSKTSSRSGTFPGNYLVWWWTGGFLHYHTLVPTFDHFTADPTVRRTPHYMHYIPQMWHFCGRKLRWQGSRHGRLWILHSDWGVQMVTATKRGWARQSSRYCGNSVSWEIIHVCGYLIGRRSEHKWIFSSSRSGWIYTSRTSISTSGSRWATYSCPCADTSIFADLENFGFCSMAYLAIYHLAAHRRSPLYGHGLPSAGRCGLQSGDCPGGSYHTRPHCGHGCCMLAKAYLLQGHCLAALADYRACSCGIWSPPMVRPYTRTLHGLSQWTPVVSSFEATRWPRRLHSDQPTGTSFSWICRTSHEYLQWGWRGSSMATHWCNCCGKAFWIQCTGLVAGTRSFSDSSSTSRGRMVLDLHGVDHVPRGPCPFATSMPQREASAYAFAICSWSTLQISYYQNLAISGTTRHHDDFPAIITTGGWDGGPPDTSYKRTGHGSFAQRFIATSPLWSLSSGLSQPLRFLVLEWIWSPPATG